MATRVLSKAKKRSDCIVRDRRRLGGDPVFSGRRVPVGILFTYLRKGISVTRFLDDFEGVKLEQVEAVLDMAESDILDKVGRA